MNNDITNPSNPNFDFEAFKTDALEKLRNGAPIAGTDGILAPMLKHIIEASLEAEMDDHLSDPQSENRRNGKSKKSLKTASGTIEIETPRDRESDFDPKLVKKRQTILNESLDNKILGLYGLGMSHKDIMTHLHEMYGVDVSSGLISKVTDKLIPVITEWRSRPLESVYPIVFLDAMFYKARENGKVVTKAVYNILGVNQQGHKDILGFYLAESEGANFWLGVLNDLKNRGINDIFIACIDGLKGFPEAIRATFPETEIQLCIIHQVRYSLKYIASKDQKPFMKGLKAVYQAPSKAIAEERLLELGEKWGDKYPMVIDSWNNKWDELSAYFKYSEDIRRMIYTTNAVEGFHRQVRKYTKTKGAFTSENALVKIIYCAYQQIRKKWNQPLRNWALTISQLNIYFEGRLDIEL